MKFGYIDLGKKGKLKLSSGKKKVLFLETLKDLWQLENVDSNYAIIGGLSNSIVSPFSKKLFITSNLKGIYLHKGKIFCYSGTTLSEFLNFQIKNNLSCLEFLTGIPQAQIGGLIAQNAGAFNMSISDVIDKIIFFDIKRQKIYFEKVQKDYFSYRNSIFKENKFFIIGATFKTFFDINIKEKIKNFLFKRLEKQPSFIQNTLGSTFKNSKHFSAGYLLEKVGLKGYKFKNFKFSEKHANFLINISPDKAHFFEFLEIIYLAKNLVKEKFNISLELEIEIFE